MYKFLSENIESLIKFGGNCKYKFLRIEKCA